MMLRTLALLAGISVGLSPMVAAAQAPPARSAIEGDPVAKPQPPSRTQRATQRAAKLSRADKQPAGTENGNQPDRASAGGGGR